MIVTIKYNNFSTDFEVTNSMKVSDLRDLISKQLYSASINILLIHDNLVMNEDIFITNYTKDNIKLDAVIIPGGHRLFDYNL
jgi:hypothetical protein